MDRVYQFAVTVPAGTLQSAPMAQNLTLENETVKDIELSVPNGHARLTGVRVQRQDLSLLPWGRNVWIIEDNYHRVFDSGITIRANDLTVYAYNEDIFPHTFYLRITMTNYVVPAELPPTPGTTQVPVGAETPIPDPLSPDALLTPDDIASIQEDEAGPMSPEILAVAQ